MTFQPRPWEFRTEPNGCEICVSHSPNAYGYIPANRGSGYDYMHRIIYRETNGLDEIPEGYEVDHICGERACGNPKHLRLLHKSDHMAVTQWMSRAGPDEERRIFWLANDQDADGLAERFDVQSKAVNRWIKRWQAEDAADRERWGL